MKKEISKLRSQKIFAGQKREVIYDTYMLQGEQKVNKHIETLIKLAQENPDMQIRIMVDSDVCEDDTYSYWLAKIISVNKDILWMDGTHAVIGEEEIKDRLGERIDSTPGSEKLTYEEYTKKVDEEFDRLKSNNELKETIIMYVGF